MVNPGVITLSETKIGGKRFAVEDNIGEAIHIHYGEFRLDMSIKEFFDFEEQLAEIINDMIGIENFDIRNFNPIYLNEQYGVFVHLLSAKIDMVKLAELKTEFTDEDGNYYIDSISKSRISEALNGNCDNLLKRKQYNMFGTTNETRLEDILKSIKDNGYPFNNEYIVLYDNEFYIRDGCHRASVLLHLFGDIEVPVLRLHFGVNIGSPEKLRPEKPRHLKNAIAIYKYYLMNSTRNKKIAIKGAGKHTKAILGIVENKDSIKVILDKNPVGQKVSQIPIVIDDEISKFEIDAVVISSFKYRNEMKDDLFKLREKFKLKFEIIDVYEAAQEIGYVYEREFYEV